MYTHACVFKCIHVYECVYACASVCNISEALCCGRIRGDSRTHTHGKERKDKMISCNITRLTSCVSVCVCVFVCARARTCVCARACVYMCVCVCV